MKKLIQSLLGRGEAAPVVDPGAAQATFDLQEAENTIATLKQDLERERAGRNQFVEEAVRVRASAIAQAAATPIGQVLAQEQLLAAGTEVPAGEVLKAAKGLIQACLDQGLELIGEAGSEATYNAARHQPLAGGALQEGQAVVVRFPGVAVDGRVIQKAGVEEAK